MNPNNPNPNQPPEQAAQQLPQPPQPWQQPPSSSVPVTPATLTPTGNRPNRFLTKVIVLVAILVIFLGGWLLLNNSGDNSDTPVTTTVPADWERLELDLGFTVEVPAAWSRLSAFDAEVNNLAATYVRVGQSSASNSQSPATTETQLTVTASSVERTDASSEQAFVEAVTDKSVIAKNFGLSEDANNEVNLASSIFDINGREWLKIDLDVSGNSTTILYYWAGDHAVGLSMVNSGDTKKDTAFYNNYLLPMAASVKVTE